MAKKQTRKSISLNHEQYVRVASEADTMGIPMAKLVEIGIDLVLAMPYPEIVKLHREHQQRMDEKCGVWRVEGAPLPEGAIQDQHAQRAGRPPEVLTAKDRSLLKARAARVTTALTMRSEGKSMSAIALALDVSRQRVYQLLGRVHVITKEEAQHELDARAARATTGHDEKIIEMVHGALA